MIQEIYTIGFTKKKAEDFFETLKQNGIDIILDIRLNNTSQLAGFSKFPDIKYFLNEICNIDYIHDKEFSPTEETLKRYKKNEINWDYYVTEFNHTMQQRNILKYIEDNYMINKSICLLCSETIADKCHRSLVAGKFNEVLGGLKIIHL